MSEWRAEARCGGLEPGYADALFFNSEDATPGAPDGRSLCRRCPVRDDCLLENLDVPYGIFGGLTAAQRHTLRAGCGAA